MFDSIKNYFTGGLKPQGLTAQIIAAKNGEPQPAMAARSDRTQATPDDWGDGGVSETAMAAKPAKGRATPVPAAEPQSASPASPASPPTATATLPAKAAPAETASIPEGDIQILRRLGCPESAIETLSRLGAAALPEVIQCHAALDEARKRVRTIPERDTVKRLHDGVVARSQQLQRGSPPPDENCVQRHQESVRQRVSHGAERREARLALLRDYFEAPASYKLPLPAEGEGGFSTEPRKRLLSDPTIQEKLLAARALFIAAEKHKLEHWDLANPLERREELEHALVHATDCNAMREIKSELVSLAAADSKAAALAAQAHIARRYRPVQDTVRELVEHAGTLLSEWHGEAKAAEALWFASAGLPHEPTTVSRRFEAVRRELAQVNSWVGVKSFFNLSDPLDRP